MSNKPDSVTVAIFGTMQQVKISTIATLLSLYDDANALLLLNSIPPVQRAWVYRALGA